MNFGPLQAIVENKFSCWCEAI